MHRLYLIGQYLAESFKFFVSFAATLGTLLALGQTLAWDVESGVHDEPVQVKKSFFDVFWNITNVHISLLESMKIAVLYQSM